MATGFKVKRRIVAVGGADLKGGLDTLAAPRRVFLPNSGTALGTGFPTSNGEICVTNRGVGTPVICVRLNGTTYFTALTAA